MEIDLVYLWVDSSDEEWKKKKNASIDANSEYAKDAINDCRFISNDELKYSLRSIEQNIPWINNIYIITDNQTPNWLDLNNSRVKIVNHSEIIPQEKLPLFNSCAIETRIPFISGLSENFLYANDDMFIWNPVDANFFFENNKAICRVGKKIQNRAYKHIYGYTINSAYKLMKSRFRIDIPYFPHHGIDAYKKSLFLECIEEFQAEFEETLNHRFRQFSDLQRIIVSYYMIYKGQGVIRTTLPNLFTSLFRGNVESECYDLKSSKIKKIIKSKAKLMCINDCRKTTDNNRKEIKDFLEKKFPNKSSFEK